MMITYRVKHTNACTCEMRQPGIKPNKLFFVFTQINFLLLLLNSRSVRLLLSKLLGYLQTSWHYVALEWHLAMLSDVGEASRPPASGKDLFHRANSFAVFYPA